MSTEMTPEEKLELLTGTIEADPGSLAPTVELASLDIWDSLSKLSILAMFSTKFKREIPIDKLRAFVTVSDIMDEMHF